MDDFNIFQFSTAQVILIIQLERNGNPLQYSSLENPRDRGAWWAAVYGVAKSRTRLKQLSSIQHLKTFPQINSKGTSLRL